MEITAEELGALVGGDVEGPGDVMLRGVGAVDGDCEGCVVFAENAGFFQKAVASRAACIVAGQDIGKTPQGRVVIRVREPREAFLKVLEYFKGPELLPSAGIGAGAVVESGARLGKGVAVGANCWVGRDAVVGDGCVLFPNVYVGAGTHIGEASKLYPGVTIYPGCRVGRRVILHAGVVIGADGFGYAAGEKALEKFPHVGTVEVGDDVEIGANSTVDRAKVGATVIGSGTKIDNLVHIAHNVKIGKNCVIVALSGVAGSVEIGDSVTLAAQSGVKDHVRIGDGCVVAARGGVIGNLPSGSVVSGFPARDHVSEKRVEAARLHLPEILKRLRHVENELKALRGESESEQDDDTDHKGQR